VLKLRLNLGVFCAAFFMAALLFAQPVSAQCANPTGDVGAMIYNSTHDLFQGCGTSGWVAFHASLAAPPPAAPTGCPTIGNTCSNGVIYAGDLNGHKLYVAANDAPTTLHWDEVTDWPPESNLTGMALCDTPFSMPSCDTGRENTAFLNSHPDPFPAAEYCAALNAHGYSTGWYLPSRNELNVVYVNLKSGKPSGTLNFLNVNYWSSSEFEGMFAYRQDFGASWQDAPNKTNLERVRCMWRE
jgi:hypothetical protein